MTSCRRFHDICKLLVSLQQCWCVVTLLSQRGPQQVSDTLVWPMRYWSLSRLIASKMIWVAFCGSQGSGTALAHRILYLRSWPTIVVKYMWFGVFVHIDGIMCVFTKNRQKTKNHARLETYCIIVLVAVESRIYFRGKKGKKQRVTNSILPGYFN